MPGQVWGDNFDHQEHINADGTVPSALLTVPDPHGTAFYPGGSDGRSHYLLAQGDDTDGQMYVDRFDATLTRLLDRWAVPGVLAADPGTTYLNLSYDTQHVAVGGGRVVVLVDQWDSSVVDPITGLDGHNLIVTVFDTAGNLVDQWTVYTTAQDTYFGDTEFAEGDLTYTSGGGSFCDGRNVYFWHGALDEYDYEDPPGTVNHVIGEEATVAKVELTTGVLTDLFNRRVESAASPNPGVLWVDSSGIVAVDDIGSGDLIVGGVGMARIGQDGTPVWFTANPDPGAAPLHISAYQAVARSGHSSVWASGPSDSFAAVASPITHEFTYAGAYVRASAWTEPVHHAWLIGEPFEYHYRWPAFGKVVADAGQR